MVSPVSQSDSLHDKIEHMSTKPIRRHGSCLYNNQSHLNQPPTLAPLLSAVRIWLHSVRGHVHMTFE